MKALGEFVIGHMTGVVLIMGAVVLMASVYELSMNNTAKGIAAWMIFIVSIYWFIRLEMHTWQKWQAAKNGEHQNDQISNTG